jgi:hypothetical protein
MPQIANVIVSQQTAPTPSVLQQTGALISQGGTTLTPGTYELLPTLQTLATYIQIPKNLTTMTWADSVATATAVAPHGYTVGVKIPMVIAGMTPAEYNGTFLATVTTTTAFTYPLLSNPGSATVEGTFLPEDVNELNQQATTFFAQGSIVPVYVLELGAGDATSGVPILEAFIAAHSSPQVFYSYLVPRYWDGNAAFLALLASYEALSSKTYFFVTTTLQTYLNYTTAMKCVLSLIECPSLGTWGSNAITELLSAPAAPTLAGSGSGGTLPAATYYVRITYVTAFGETVPSPEVTQVITLGEDLVIDSPPAMTGATGWNAYVSSTTGTETLQNASPTAIATNLTITAPLSAGAVLPTSGVAVATTTTAHGVAVGEWFQFSGFTPTGYNGWYPALGGTSGETLVLPILTDLAPESVLGSLDASFASATGIGSSEFTLAAVYYKTLGYNPSSTNMMTALQFSFLFGVTGWPTQGTTAIQATLQTANVNIVIPASQGGIAENMLVWGMTADGNQYTWWYSADWAQINYALTAANIIINGSNNPTNPLYLNQNGINQIQDGLMQTSATAVAVGLANGIPTRSALTGTALAAALDAGTYDGDILINAVPFNVYYQQNPGQYKTGTYNGYSIQYIPQLSFEQITINLVLTDFPAGA